jgi:ubiquinone biosynthesis protein COQ9
MASLSARRFLSHLLSSRRFPPPTPLSRLYSTTTPPFPTPSPASPPVDPPPPLPRDLPPSSHSTKEEKHSHSKAESHEKIKSKKAVGDYEDEQAKVLRAALHHVPRLGWSESAMIAGARDVGVSPSIIGAFSRKEAALVEFFMDDCLERLIDQIESGEGEKLKNLILSERLSKLIRMRLEMQVSYVSKWPQALSIQSQPANLPNSLKQRAALVDEIWHAAGDAASDIEWYVKRTLLGGIYSASEIYMITDNSPEFRDTWQFVDKRVKDALDLQKTVQEAGYLAETVGAGVGQSMQGFVKRVFQR